MNKSFKFEILKKTQVKFTKHKISHFKTGNSGAFCIYNVVQQVPLLSSSKILSSPQRKSQPIKQEHTHTHTYIYIISFPLSLETTNLCSMSMDLPILGFSYKWSHDDLSFCVLLHSLSMILLRIIHIVV